MVNDILTKSKRGGGKMDYVKVNCELQLGGMEMNQREKRKMAVMLTFVMLAVFLCGGTVMAQENQYEYKYVQGIHIGDRIMGIGALAPSEIYPDYTNYSFFVNGKGYPVDAASGYVLLNKPYDITNLYIDNDNRTINVSGDFLIDLQLNGQNSLKKRGEVVSVNLSEAYRAQLDAMDENDVFYKWYVWTYDSSKDEFKEYDLNPSAAFLNVTPETLTVKECNITFTIPDEWEQYTKVGIKPAIQINSGSISGNVPPQPDTDVSTVSGNSSSSSGTAAPEAESKKDVVFSNGTAIKSMSAMQNVARGINGAAIVTSQKDMNIRAGLSDQDVAAGSKAKLYIGNTYKESEKTQLNVAVSQMGMTSVNMINIDLYSITKSGKVANIKEVVGQDHIRLIIELPTNLIKEGRSFSLVYMGADGNAVEIQDLDNDPRTLTVDLTRFGSFAIVYR